MRAAQVLLVLIAAVLATATLAVHADPTPGGARGLLKFKIWKPSCGKTGQKCCRKRGFFKWRKKKCNKGNKCEHGICVEKKPPPFQPVDSLSGEPCALKGQHCCSGAADEPVCVGGLTCDGPFDTNSQNTCVPCGGKNQLACQRFGRIAPEKCKEGLVVVEDKESGKEFCRNRKGNPDPFQPTDSLSGKPCALKGQNCCSGAADEPLCVAGLVCDGPSNTNVENTCKPCGGRDELACRRQGFGPAPEPCKNGLKVVRDNSSGKDFCRKKGAPEPSCPGVEGDPCCTFIADASPCGQFVTCSTSIPGPDKGKPISEGTCVSCGGEHEFACFEIGFAGVSGPICEPGLSANKQDPPKCVVGGQGPPCTGLQCPAESD